jgi:hypothetical protein
MSKKYETEMEGWIAALRDINEKELSERLLVNTGNRLEALLRLEQLGLPTYDRLSLSLEDFLDRPKLLLTEFNHPSYHAILSPRKSHLLRYSKTRLKKWDDIQKFVDKKIENKDRKNYYLILQEYEECIYGGTIVSNDKILHVDLCLGKPSGVSKGKANVITATKRNGPYLPSFSYSTKDDNLRSVIWDILQYIRFKDYKSERQTDITFLKGYFEFAVSDKGIKKGLRIAFLDYNTSAPYTNI